MHYVLQLTDPVLENKTNMSTICARCALRLQRAAQASNHHTTKRTFSQTTTKQKHRTSLHLPQNFNKHRLTVIDGVPTFSETSSPELNDVLASMRNKHFIPAALHKADRRLIFGTKSRQTLADNPQTVKIGGEDVQLQWMERRKEIPNRRKLLHKAFDLMAAGEGKEWQNLPALLTGLKGAGAPAGEKTLGRIVRKAIQAGRTGVVVQCLQQGVSTGMTLDKEEVLENVTWGLHATAQRDGWSEAAVLKALKAANQVGMLLETEEHGGGRVLHENDARRRPEVIGVFLELAAVHAFRFQDGKDVDGKAKTYAERLLGCIDGAIQVRPFPFH